MEKVVFQHGDIGMQIEQIANRTGNILVEPLL